jgi:hypothetical protein
LQAIDIVYECLGQASCVVFNLLDPSTEIMTRFRAAVSTACAEISKAEADFYGLRPIASQAGRLDIDYEPIETI